MKRTIVRTALATIFLATLHLCLAPAMRAQDDGGCSNATVAGKWGYTYVGTIILPTATGTVTVPVAAVGRFTLDRDGNLSGTQTRSNGGVSAQETITAKIIVDAGCTATGNFYVYDSGQLVRTATLALVFDDDSREARTMFESLTLANGHTLPVVITVESRKISSAAATDT
jgi:hypothetical protein